MKKQALIAILLMLLVVAIAAPAAFAEDPGEPIGACPTAFDLHQVGMHSHEDHDSHMHQHVGLDSELNGDGYWCVKHVGTDGNIHVHVDNYLPLD